jgi:hypothetical protein
MLPDGVRNCVNSDAFAVAGTVQSDGTARTVI